jgi:hypothetical protein
MMFVLKQPCNRERSLRELALLFYPLYNPVQHHIVFNNEGGTCEWLSQLLEWSLTELGYPPDGLTVWTYDGDFIALLSSMEELWIPITVIEDAEFHLDCVDSYLPWPVWFSSSHGFLLSSLSQCTRDDLFTVLEKNSTVFGDKLLYNGSLMLLLVTSKSTSKSDMIAPVINWFFWYRSLLWSLQYPVLKSLVQWLMVRSGMDVTVQRCT